MNGYERGDYSRGSVINMLRWGEVQHSVKLMIYNGYYYMGSGTFCETVVSEQSLLVSGCILFLFMFKTSFQLLWNWVCISQNVELFL